MAIIVHDSFHLAQIVYIQILDPDLHPEIDCFNQNLLRIFPDIVCDFDGCWFINYLLPNFLEYAEAWVNPETTRFLDTIEGKIAAHEKDANVSLSFKYNWLKNKIGVQGDAFLLRAADIKTS